MGNSSVSIPSELRKRIKRLAAEKDTSQAKIIEEAINRFDSNNKSDKNRWSTNEHAYLERISNELYKNKPDRKIRVGKLKKMDSTLDEAIMRTWQADLLE
jgi:hypothetical protein